MKSIKTFAVIISIVLVPAFAFAGGSAEAEAPTLSIPVQPRVYISPGNGDGVQDILELPFSSVVTPAEDMVIVEYNLSVFDSSGAVVYSVSEIQEGRIGFFGGVFGGEKPRVEIPDNLTWDGTYRNGGSDDGDLVPDGEYTYQLTVIDDAGGFARSAPFNATVDNEGPEITEYLESPYTIFSPNGDNLRDTVSFRQAGSREIKWVLAIVDSGGDTVFESVRENETPSNRGRDVVLPARFDWDGTDGRGNVAPEGDYSLVITGTDRAGNSTVGTHPQTITLSLTAAELALAAEDGVYAFSPNGDGARDELILVPSASNTTGLSEWQFQLLLNDQPAQRSRGTGTLPRRITVSGLRDDGTPLPDGVYHAVLTATFINGNVVASDRREVVVDTVAPAAIVAVQTAPEETEAGAPMVFGGAAKARIDLQLRYDADLDWNVELRRDGDIVVSDDLSFFVNAGGVEPTRQGGTAGLDLQWNGVLPDELGGGQAPDGLYSLILTAVDEAGNAGSSNLARVIKDGRRPSVALEADGRYVSPRGRGDESMVVLRPVYPQADGVAEFHLEVRNDRDRMVASRYVRQPFERYEWRGITNGNTFAPDGDYSALLRVIYQNGHVAEATYAGPITVDSTRPRIVTFDAAYRRFSPDDDGERDTITINQSVEPGDNWTAFLYAADGTVIYEIDFGDRVNDLTWDGMDAGGERVPDGEYRYVLRGVDLAGNETSEDMDIVLDTVSIPLSAQAPVVAVGVSPRVFSPDGDGVDEETAIALSWDAPNELARWDVQILDPRGRPFRRFSGRGNPPRRLWWDGLADDGELVQAATDYEVVAQLTDVNGNVGEGRGTSSVDILVMVDGDRLRIRISTIQFAPNTPDLFRSEPEQLDANLDTLRRLAQILNRYQDREIIVEGHAAHVFLEGEAKEREQRLELLPLSNRRAIEVMQALIILGVDGDRMEPIGYGGLYPVVPHADRPNMWKNRRVEFLLVRPQ